MEHDDFSEIHEERCLYFDKRIALQNNKLIAFDDGIAVKSHSNYA